MHYISKSNQWFIAANITYQKSTKNKSIGDRKLTTKSPLSPLGIYDGIIHQTLYHLELSCTMPFHFDPSDFRSPRWLRARFSAWTLPVGISGACQVGLALARGHTEVSTASIGYGAPTSTPTILLQFSASKFPQEIARSRYQKTPFSVLLNIIR